METHKIRNATTFERTNARTLFVPERVDGIEAGGFEGGIAAEDERDGYVPNVVYSCGGLVHNDNLIIPYAVSDTWTSVAVLPLCDLLTRLRSR